MTVRRFPTNWVGFEQLFEALSLADSRQESHTATTFPPHNIITLDENHSIIELAVAGFGPEDLDIEWKDNELTIVGNKEEQDDRKYQQKGIAGRKFTKRFRLGEHIVPSGSYYKNGIVGIELERVIPETEKPKKLNIRSGESKFLQD